MNGGKDEKKDVEKCVNIRLEKWLDSSAELEDAGDRIGGRHLVRFSQLLQVNGMMMMIVWVYYRRLYTPHEFLYLSQ